MGASSLWLLGLGTKTASTDICRVNRGPLLEICIDIFVSWGHSKSGEGIPTNSLAVSPNPASVEEKPCYRGRGRMLSLAGSLIQSRESVGGSESPEVNGILGPSLGWYFPWVI